MVGKFPTGSYFVASLISQIYPPQKVAAIQSLWKDDEPTRPLIQKAISEHLGQSKDIVMGHSLDQLCMIMSLATFINSDEEPITVAVMLMFCLKSPDVLPQLSVHRGKTFAARSLVSLALFYEALERKCKYHGSPTPDYYRQVGKLYFEQEKMPEIVRNFENWESYIRTKFN